MGSKRKSYDVNVVAPDKTKKLTRSGGNCSLISVRISAYTNQSRVSHSVRMRENSAKVYPK